MRSLCLLAALVAAPALAQTPGSCETGTAQATLDVSDVQASLFNTGGLFFGGSTTSGDGYLVPKETGRSPVFAAGVWLGGRVDGDLRVAAARYGNWNFWPGPLNADGSLPNSTDCSAYDRIYVVSTYDLVNLRETGRATDDLRDWPVGLGAPAVDASGQPVVPTSRDQTLDLRAEERPVVYGTQTAFWVMNDVGNEHPATGSTAPIGAEVQVTAFALVSEEMALYQGTFYRFTIINRNPSAISDARFSFSTDPDLGGAGDDYIGTDSTRNMGIPYSLAAPGRVRLAAYDVLGREVAVLHDAPQAAGPHETLFDTSRLAAGVYLIRLRMDDEARTRRLTVVR